MKFFTLGFEYPVRKEKKGRIYLKGIHFGNYWCLDESWGPEKAGKIYFNRDALALEMHFPVWNLEETHETLLLGLELHLRKWLETNKLEDFVKTC